jgi:hypothetical protein
VTLQQEPPVAPQPAAPARAGGWPSLILWAIAGSLAVAVIAVAAFKAWPLLYPDISERAPLNADCDLIAGPCRVRFASGGEVVLDILPRGIPAVHPLTITASLIGLPAPQRVEIDFAGVDMDMGFNRTALQPASVGSSGAEVSSDREGVRQDMQWSGTGMLPVCVRQRMTWEARVLLHYPQRLLAAPFRFDTLRPEDR